MEAPPQHPKSKSKRPGACHQLLVLRWPLWAIPLVLSWWQITGDVWPVPILLGLFMFRELDCPKGLMQVIRGQQRDAVRQKLKQERWMRLTSDLLSTYQEGKDFIVTPERVECWRSEWSDLTGMNYHDYR